MAAAMDDWQQQSPSRMAYSVLRPGPFISGTTHRVLQLGQRPVAGTGGDGQAEAQAEVTRRESHGAAAPQAAGSKGGGGTSLAELIAAGLLKPGRNKLSVSYKSEKFAATLTKDGMIIWQGKKFASPTAFTAAVKKQAGPGRQGNDGWRQLMYEGNSLESIRRRYATKYSFEPMHIGEAEVLEDLEAPAACAAAGNAAGEPATDQWVQCDRCDIWRVVPDASWPKLAAAESDSWACCDADWDVLTTLPFTPPCSG